MSKSYKKITAIFLTVVLTCLFALTGCTSSKGFPLDQSGTQEQSGLQNSSNNASASDGTNASTTNPTQNDTPVRTDPSDTTQAQTTQTETSRQGDAVQQDSSGLKVKALYLTGWTVSSTAKVNHYVELANTTEINSYVIDIKDDDGYVGYESQIPEVQQNKAWMKKYDPEKVIKAMHDGGVHVIGRIVSFKDPVYSVKRPDLAMKNKSGGIYKDGNGKSWLNPYNKENWTYLVNIAKEAVQKGFDEIQFDYVRFPSDKKSTMDFGGTTEQKYEAIDGFLAYAKNELKGVTVSADVFGIICESPADTEGIGQNLEYVGKDIDYISPMVYPSHYAYGQIVNKVEFAKPDLDPYNVVYNSLVKAKDRISKVSDYKAGVRPYLQDFTASWLKKGYYQDYGSEQVRQQIKAVYDAGYDQWILWDAGNKYDEGALLKKN